MNRKQFGARLRDAMTGMSARAFAAQAGIAPTTFNKIANGEQEPTRPTLLAIARAAGVSLDWLVAGEGPMRPEAAGSAARPPLDEVLLELAVRLLEEWLQERRLVLRPEPKAKAIVALYEIALEAQAEGRQLEPRQVDRILRLVA